MFMYLGCCGRPQFPWDLLKRLNDTERGTRAEQKNNNGAKAFRSKHSYVNEVNISLSLHKFEMNRNSWGNTSLVFSAVNIRRKINFNSLTSYGKCWKNFNSTVPYAVACIFKLLVTLNSRIPCYVRCWYKEVLAVWKSHRKKFLRFENSTAKKFLRF